MWDFPKCLLYAWRQSGEPSAMKAANFLFVFLVGLSSCGGPVFSFQEIAVGKLDFATVWNEATQVISSVEGSLNPVGTDRGLKVMESRWNTRTFAFGKGRRTRVHLEIVRKDPLEHLVRFYVERQKNGNMRRIFNPEEGDWEDAGQDSAKESILRYHLRSRFAAARNEAAPSVLKSKALDPFKEIR